MLNVFHPTLFTTINACHDAISVMLIFTHHHDLLLILASFTLQRYFFPLKLKYFFQTTFKEYVNKTDSCVMVLCQFTWNKYLNGIKILKFGSLESYKNIKFAVQTFTRNVVIFKSPTLWHRRKEPRSSIDSNQQYMWLSMIAINFRKERRKVEGA